MDIGTLIGVLVVICAATFLGCMIVYLRRGIMILLGSTQKKDPASQYQEAKKFTKGLRILAIVLIIIIVFLQRNTLYEYMLSFFS